MLTPGSDNILLLNSLNHLDEEPKKAIRVIVENVSRETFLRIIEKALNRNKWCEQ